MSTVSRNKKKIYDGIHKIARVVKSTYGPQGRAVLLERSSGFLPTKDGYTIIQETTLEDPYENLGVSILKDVCRVLNEKVGDGTTTAAILAEAFLRYSLPLTVSTESPQIICKMLEDIEEKSCAFVDSITEGSKSVLHHIARSALKDDTELIPILVEASTSVGKYGKVLVEEGQSVDTKLEFKDGIELECGWNNVYNTKELEVFEGVLVAVVDSGIDSFLDLKEILEESTQFPANDLVIFSHWLEGEALATLEKNQELKRSISIRSPGTGLDKTENLKDIAALTGATLIDPQGYDIRKFKSEYFGTARRIKVDSRHTRIETYEEHEESIQSRIKSLNKQCEHAEYLFDRDKIQERMSRLSQGLAIVKVGGFDEMSRKEKRGRIEDALGSILSAINHGVVLGGGCTFRDIYKHITSENKSLSYKIICKAFLEPIRCIMEGMNFSGSWGLEKIKEMKNPFGWDAYSQEFKDMKELGIWIPKETLTLSIKSALSVTKQIVLCDVLITK